MKVKFVNRPLTPPPNHTCKLTTPYAHTPHPNISHTSTPHTRPTPTQQYQQESNQEPCKKREKHPWNNLGLSRPQTSHILGVNLHNPANEGGMHNPHTPGQPHKTHTRKTRKQPSEQPSFQTTTQTSLPHSLKGSTWTRKWPRGTSMKLAPIFLSL